MSPGIPRESFFIDLDMGSLVQCRARLNPKGFSQGFLKAIRVSQSEKMHGQRKSCLNCVRNHVGFQLRFSMKTLKS